MDMTFHTPKGKFNYRVGAIIIKDGKVLVAKNAKSTYFYSVGGRVRYNETSEEAVKREVKEELGIDMEIDRVVFFHEHFFDEKDSHEHFHELSIYYLMKVQENIKDIVYNSVTEDGVEETFMWLPIDNLKQYVVYPEFLATELLKLPTGIKHIVGVQNKTDSIIGNIVTVTIDRPLGSYHPKHRDIYYPINYGYVEGIMAPDGEEQDAYILGVDIPVETFTGKVIAVVHRNNDVEEKWVVCPENMSFSKKEIRQQIHFQEQYFDSEIKMN